MSMTRLNPAVRYFWFALLALAGSLAASAEPVAGQADKTILALGDSLTAGYGLGPQEGFTAQLEDWLRERGHDARVINAGVSGDTTSGGRSRLTWVLDGLETPPDLVIVALGGNDMLRSIPPEITRKNMDAIVATLKARGLDVLVAGMRAPPNRGPGYREAFDPIFREVAQAHEAAFYPFFLKGVATQPDLLQPDGLHPNAEGVREMVRNIGPVVAKQLTAEPSTAENRQKSLGRGPD